MKLTISEKNKDIPVFVISENEKKYGIVVGTGNHMVCVLLNSGEYVDVPDSKVKRISKKTSTVSKR